jgi:hypothetical protein
MTLAAVLAFYCLSLGCSMPGIGAPSEIAGMLAATTVPPSIGPASQQGTSSSQQAPATQSPESSPSSPAPSSQPPTPAPAPPPAAKTRRRHKKAATPDCSSAPAALNTAASNATGAANATPGNVDSSSAGSSNAAPPAQKPCPPPKVVVRNGGSNEPNVELKGGSAAEASYQRSTTEQLVKETDGNLNKIKELQLTASQQETVTQINHFLEQSKAAVAAGDAERGRNLAMKARLLSDELLKP